MSENPTLAIDFDGVLHSYTSGWQGESVVADPPVPGAMRFLRDALDYFRVCIFTTRASSVTGLAAVYTAIQRWLLDEHMDPQIISHLIITDKKPIAQVYIDDRAFAFSGYFPDPSVLREFRPWNKRGEDADHPNCHPDGNTINCCGTLIDPITINQAISAFRRSCDWPDTVVAVMSEQTYAILRDRYDADGIAYFVDDQVPNGEIFICKDFPYPDEDSAFSEMIVRDLIVSAGARIYGFDTNILNYPPPGPTQDDLDDAYDERNRLVSLVTKVFNAQLAVATDAEPGFNYVVLISLPTGQVSFHIPDESLYLFSHLEIGNNTWDGHDNETKWDRILDVFPFPDSPTWVQLVDSPPMLLAERDAFSTRRFLGGPTSE